MLPTRWDPFKDLSKELGTLHHELDELFRRTFGSLGSRSGAEGMMTPAINSYVKGETFHVQAELPGLRREDLDVSVEGGTLTLRGERKSDKEIKDGDYLIREARSGSFVRQIPLPEGVDIDKVHASYEDGILNISMPMAKSAGGRKIAIEGGKRKELH